MPKRRKPAARNDGPQVNNSKPALSVARKRVSRIPDKTLLNYPFTDSGNAERLVLLFGDRIRYCRTYRVWLVWDGKRWKRDMDGELNRMAKEVARRLNTQALSIQDDEEQHEVENFARHSESAAGIRATLECAQSEQGISIGADELDRDPMLLNCANGTVDLQTTELRPHSSADLIAKLCPVVFDLDAQCILFLRFLVLLY